MPPPDVVAIRLSSPEAEDEAYLIRLRQAPVVPVVGGVAGPAPTRRTQKRGRPQASTTLFAKDIRTLQSVQQIGREGNYSSQQDTPLSSTDTLSLSPPRAVSLYSVALPDVNVMNYLFTSFLGKQYIQNPGPVRPELLSEIRLGVMPDYCLLATYLWSCRWDADIINLVGPVQRAEIMHNLFTRITKSLMPHLEVALAGFQAMVDPRLSGDQVDPVALQPPRNSRETYVRTCVYVILTLYYLLGVAMADPRPPQQQQPSHGNINRQQSPPPDTDSFRSVYSLLKLIIRVYKVSQVYDPRVSARRLPAMITHPGSNMGSACQGIDYFSIWIERVRRIWSGCVVQDLYFSAMYGTDPAIAWQDYRWLRGLLDDNQVETARKLFEEQQKGAHPGQPGDHQIIDPVFDTASQMDTPLPPAPEPEFNADLTDVVLTAPLRTIFPTPQVQMFNTRLVFTLRLAQLACLVGRYRRLVPNNPYLDRPGKLHLAEQLKHFLSEMPPPFPNGVLPLVVANKDRLTLPHGLGIGLMAYVMMIFHASFVTLSSPTDASLLAGELDVDWVSSPAFVVAVEHAIQATQYLIPLVEGAAMAPVMAMPFFQHCILRTGLIHHLSCRLLVEQSAREGSYSAAVQALDVLETSRAQLMVHHAAITKAQGGVGLGDRRSWWYEMWCKVTGLQ